METSEVIRLMNSARTLEDVTTAKRAAEEHLRDHPEDQVEIYSAMESLVMLEEALAE